MDKDTSWSASELEESKLAGFSELREFTRVDTQGSDRRSGTPEYYRWKLFENPNGKGIATVAISNNSEIVGTTSITPKPIVLNSQRITGGEIGDTFTHPSFQRKGIFSALVTQTRELAHSQTIEFVYGTPNDASLPGYEKKLNFGQAPNASLVGLVLPINFEPLLAARLNSSFLAKLLTPFVTLVYKSIYRLSAIPNGITIQAVDELPKSIDSFCKAALNDFDLFVDRNYDYFKWRFADNPDNYNILTAVENNKITGYTVSKKGTWRDLNAVYIADFLAKDQPTFLSLVKHIKMQNPDADMIATWTNSNSWYHRALKKIGFQKYTRVPIICYRNEIGESVIDGDLKWHFTMSDSDNI